jgi:hypothetical protein
MDLAREKRLLLASRAAASPGIANVTLPDSRRARTATDGALDFIVS